MTFLISEGSLAERFEGYRPRLVGIAYRMLGSVSEAEDAVQDAWLRLGRADAAAIRDLEGWLVTAVSRQCLDVLRARRARSGDTSHLPEPLVAPDGPLDPEAAAVLGEAIGLALLVVLDRLAPAERLAFVLHDVFGLPFEEIAAILGRTPAAARQLASRARKRVRGAPLPSGDLQDQREVVDVRLPRDRRLLSPSFPARLPASALVVEHELAIPGEAEELREEIVMVRSRTAMQHEGPPQIEAGADARHIALTQNPQLVAEQRVHVPGQDAAGRELVAVSRFGQKRFAPQLLRGAFNGLFERQMLERVQRIVVDEDADRTLRRKEGCQPIDHAREGVRRAGVVGTGTMRHQDDDDLPTH